MFAALDALAVDGSVSNFAQANGLKYQRRSRPPMLSGGPFERYTNAKVRGSVTGPGWMVGQLDVGDGVVRRPATLFGMQVEVASSFGGAPRSGPPIGYLALTLPQHLPNMILDSRRNDSAFGSNLVHPPSGDQRLSLEGDFDTHFGLFVPSGYERDALYIFTPDLMALLIEEAADVDVEIRGDQFVVYVPGGLDLARVATWHWIERIMTVLGAKTFSRSVRYSDERVVTGSADRVAPVGQKLRRRLTSREVGSRASLVVGIVIFAVIALAVVGTALIITLGFALTMLW